MTVQVQIWYLGQSNAWGWIKVDPWKNKRRRHGSHLRWSAIAYARAKGLDVPVHEAVKLYQEVLEWKRGGFL
jgi:hypothetical protein